MEISRASLLVSLIAVAAAACSSEESVADQRQLDGSGASAGSDSGSGGSTNDASFPDASAQDAADACSAYCDTLTQSTCSATPTHDACLQFCQAALDVMTDRGCAAETSAALACYANVPPTSYSCDQSGAPALPADACTSEHAAIDACLCQSTCTVFAAVGCPNFSQDVCESGCGALGQACPACRSQFVSALICQSGQPTSAYQCNANGDVESLPGTCADELSSYQACPAAACPPP